MNETVDSFLKEINEIAPPKNVWEECFDDNSGFAYYWNTQTDEVTWDVPEGFKKSSGQNAKTNPKKVLYIPPPSEEKIMLGSIPRLDRDTVKIYKLDDISKTTSNDKNASKNTNAKENCPQKPSSKQEDERTRLISSYDTGSSSEEDEKLTKRRSNDSEYNTSLNSSSNYPVPNKSNSNKTPAENKTYSPYNSEDELDILTQIQTKAKMLKQLGGDIPEGVKSLVPDSIDRKEVTGFSLVAGYGNDSDEESEEEEEDAEPTRKSIFPIEEKRPISTLFPISKPVDVAHFCENGSERTNKPTEESLPMKAFQRKRRIGVSLVNVQKKHQHHHQQQQQQNDSPEELERPGFGFKGGTPKEYPGFKSGGIIFAKEEEPSHTAPAQNVEMDSVEYVKASDEKLLKDVDDTRNTLNEKLKFLCEGHSPALPVQIMIIQMDTLYTAMKEKCLYPRYLKDWLNNTCEDLTKLEKEAAPAGWLLQWDRLHKRYYYRNQATGENQWQYPQPDIVSVDEAMDISTTPPPPVLSDDEPQPVESMNLILPPPPPQIKERSVTPPPPPVISDFKVKETLNNGEPFPPGVDEADEPKAKDFAETKTELDTSFTSELDSFYSDIATMSSNQQLEQPEVQIKENTATLIATPVDAPPLKKKKKAKMGQGLAMKKKGVSKLVEKWKNVQKNYN